MALAVRIEVMSPPCTSPWLRLEPNWWNADELIRDRRFRYEPEMAGYDDYVAELTRAEFADLHRRYMERIPGSVWDSVGWAKTIKPKVSMLAAAIALADPERDRFVVTVFEWSSGY